jgi:hypothetical protein
MTLSMNGDRLYALCYERLSEQNQRRDHFTTRAGLFMTAIVILAGAAMSVGRLDLLNRLFLRVDLFLFHAFSALVWVGIVIALWFTIRMLWPISYEVLPSMAAFLQWRDEYEKDLCEAGYSNEEPSQIATDRMLLELCRCACRAADVNFAANKSKQRASSRCVYTLTATAALLGVMLLLSRILLIQGF